MCEKSANFRIALFLLFEKVIALFQNGRLPNPACWAICTFKNSFFFHTFALLKSGIVWSHFLVAILKIAIVQLHFLVALLKVRSHFLVALLKSVIVWSYFFCIFQTWDKMCDRAIAILKIANVQKMFEFENGTFLHFKKNNHTFSKCAIAQPWEWECDWKWERSTRKRTRRQWINEGEEQGR